MCRVYSEREQVHKYLKMGEGCDKWENECRLPIIKKHGKISRGRNVLTFVAITIRPLCHEINKRGL